MNLATLWSTDVGLGVENVEKHLPGPAEWEANFIADAGPVCVQPVHVCGGTDAEGDCEQED